MCIKVSCQALKFQMSNTHLWNKVSQFCLMNLQANSRPTGLTTTPLITVVVSPLRTLLSSKDISKNLLEANKHIHVYWLRKIHGLAVALRADTFADHRANNFINSMVCQSISSQGYSEFKMRLQQ